MHNGTQIEVPHGRMYGSPANYAKLIEYVANQFDFDTAVIHGKGRSNVVCIARHAVATALYVLCPSISLPAIGRAMRKDHSTIINSLCRHGLGPKYQAAASAIRQTWRESITGLCNASPDNQTHDEVVPMRVGPLSGHAEPRR